MLPQFDEAVRTFVDEYEQIAIAAAKKPTTFMVMAKSLSEPILITAANSSDRIAQMKAAGIRVNHSHSWAAAYYEDGKRLPSFLGHNEELKNKLRELMPKR